MIAPDAAMRMHVAIAALYNELAYLQARDAAALGRAPGLLEHRAATATIARRGVLMDRISCCIVLSNAFGTVRASVPS